MRQRIFFYLSSEVFFPNTNSRSFLSCPCPLSIPEFRCTYALYYCRGILVHKPKRSQPDITWFLCTDLSHYITFETSLASLPPWLLRFVPRPFHIFQVQSPPWYFERATWSPLLWSQTQTLLLASFWFLRNLYSL